MPEPSAAQIRRRLHALAMNLLWTWDRASERLFESLDPALYEALDRNPVAVLEALDDVRLRAVAAAAPFVRALRDVEQRARRYQRRRTWFDRHVSRRSRTLRVAYFCSEFGLHSCLPQYAGGLGVLAGDHLKTASDLGVPMVGVGLLYRHGYYRQRVGPDGSTQVIYPHYDFRRLPIRLTGRRVEVPLGRRVLHAQIWRAQVGRVPLLLLDTDIDANPPALRRITDRLYGGDARHRLHQQLLLGIGGVRALHALKIRPTVYHLNEGHAAFCGLQRLYDFRRAGLGLDEAIRRVRATTLFTTHTPVPAGHDRYDPRLIARALGPLARLAGLSVSGRPPMLRSRQAAPPTDLLSLGREDPSDPGEPFCMTVLAIRLAGAVNGVSALHGKVTGQMWASLLRAPAAQRSGQAEPQAARRVARPASRSRVRVVGLSDLDARASVGHVTNGIHTATWLDEAAQVLYARYLGIDPLDLEPDDPRWQKADRIPPEALWSLRNRLRRRLVRYVRQQLARQWLRAGFSPQADPDDVLDEGVLTIGFARRFATYKRAVLMFRDVRRLERIVNDPRRPVQIVFAGKAHPADGPGQRFCRRVWQLARRPALRRRIVLLEDYDMHMGRILTSGCDVWLNTPRKPMEASGTSGMKPALHGGLNLSIADGWWAEGYNGRNGWVIRSAQVRSEARQDRLDAQALYDLLEQQVVPLFYRRDRSGVPQGWVRRMIESIRSIAGRFGAQRMLAEYVGRYYLPMHARAR